MKTKLNVKANLKIDLHVNPADTQKYLHSFSYHRYHCKKGVPYSQTLRLNRIYSDRNLLKGDVMTHKHGYYEEAIKRRKCRNKY